jgi:citrate lyase beta subunit
MRCRSMLFTPAHQLNKVHRALNSEADIVVLDCEDSVPTVAGKETAYSIIATLPITRPFWVRVPKTLVPRHVLTRCRGVILPKMECAEQVRAELDTLSIRAGAPLQAFVVIETPAAVVNAAAMAQVPGVVGLIFGPYDLAASLVRRVPDLAYPRSVVLYAAKAAGKLAIDVGVRHRAFDEGWDGVAVLNMPDVDAANTLMAHRNDDVAWAAGIVSDTDPEVHYVADGVTRQLIAPPIRALASRLLSQAKYR